MIKDKPFVKLFKTPANYYLYDVNRNSILKIDNKTYNYLVNYDDYSDNALIESVTIKNLRSNSFLSSNKTREIIHPSDKLLPYYLNNNVRMMTLQVTQQCNFRCEYCVYSGSYSNRTHTNKRMSISTAFKGIDFLINHSKNSNEIILGFYGGEPLLEFDLIKKCIDYAEKKAEGRNLQFAMTTNGSLLTDDIISYLSKHNVNLTISLDGPKEIHDIHRKFASNNCGTFNTVMKNIINLKTNYPTYTEKILFNAVIDAQNNFNCIDEFFTKDKTVKDINMMSSLISNKYSNSNIQISDSYNSQTEYELFKIFYYKVKKKDIENCSRIMMQEYFRIVQLGSEMLPQEKLPAKMHHGGPCIPGVQRLFMNVDGFLYPCEKASETSEHMKIGHIDSGFDIEKSRKILNIGKIDEDSCKNCWAIRLCILCAPCIDDTHSFSSKLKYKHCANMKAMLIETLKNYCVLKELGCDLQEEFNHKIKNEKQFLFNPKC